MLHRIVNEQWFHPEKLLLDRRLMLLGKAHVHVLECLSAYVLLCCPVRYLAHSHGCSWPHHLAHDFQVFADANCGDEVVRFVR